jgi:putative transport protein
VIAPRERMDMDEVSRFFGNSVRALAEVDTITFGLGIVLGLLVGQIAVAVPGGGAFRLGHATVLPLATVAKIVVAQLIVGWL